jgi:chromosome segregation ATPase
MRYLEGRDAMSDDEKPSWEWRAQVEALTKQLAEVTRERDEMEAYVSRIRLGQELGFVRKQVEALKQQLADRNHELKELSGYNDVVTQERGDLMAICHTCGTNVPHPTRRVPPVV